MDDDCILWLITYLSAHSLEAEGVGAGGGGPEDAEPQLVEGFQDGDEQPRAALVGEHVDEERPLHS